MHESLLRAVGDRGIPAVLTLREVAELTRLSPETVRRWVKSGVLPSFRVGDQKQIRVYRADLETLLRAGRPGEGATG